MFYICSVLIKISLITCVVGKIKIDTDKLETEIKLTDLEEHINHTLNEVERNILEKLITIDGKVNASNKNKEENFEEKLTQTLNALTTKMENLEEKITQAINESNYKVENNLEEKITKALNVFNDKKEFLENNRTISDQLLLCKELSVNRMLTQTYPIDNETFEHVALKRISSGQLMYFEMHLALEADKNVAIQLWDKNNLSNSNIRFYLDIGLNNNQYTELQYYQSKTIQRTHTPDILSSTQMRTFYIKIDNGNLDFGKEGDNSPLLSYYDAGFKSVNYITFGNWANEAKILYDCPAPFCKEVPCKKESLTTSYRNSPYFTMDNEALNHVTLKRNSTGVLTYFEMHTAIEADGEVTIVLTDTGREYDSINRYKIFVGHYYNQYTMLSYKGKIVQRIYTPDILFQFTAFYIKIDDGKLEFGKEGESSPILSYYDTRFKSVNFFQFYYGGSYDAKIRYDCPVPVEGY